MAVGIDTYLSELDNALRGPRRTRADMIAEARDHLVDATEGYERGGLPRTDAELAAVTDFGRIEEIAPAFQAELGYVQGRRTAGAVLVMSAIQPVVWGVAFQQLTGAADQPLLADDLVERLGGIAIVLAAVAVLAYRIGHPGGWLMRATGVTALSVCAMLVAFSTLLSFLNADHVVMNLAWTTAFVLVPAALVVRSARRCLAAAR